jgi:hypothetical protein
MSDVVDCINLLEILGGDAASRGAGPSGLEGSLAAPKLDPALLAAIVAGDGRLLGSLLNARDNVCCLVEPGKEEEEEEGEEEPEDEDADEESEDEHAASRNRALHPLADVG